MIEKYLNFGPIQESKNVITISSDGDLSPDDTVRSTASDIIQTGKTIYDTSLTEFFQHKVFNLLEEAKTKLPNECQECMWKNICAGGEPVNRYSKENGFNNPSIYCNSLKRIYKTATQFLLKNGANKDLIIKSLQG